MILTISGASGAGKTTIAKGLLKDFPIYPIIIPSYTIHGVRKPRPTDIPGEYKYVCRLWFRFLEKTGSFLWTVHVHGYSYGTTRRSVVRALEYDNKVCIMILTPKGVNDLKKFAEKLGYSDRMFYFYIISPSQEVLRERLKLRGDQEDEIEKRLADCVKWDLEARALNVPFEFVKNDDTIESVVKDVTTRLLEKLGSCDCYF